LRRGEGCECDGEEGGELHFDGDEEGRIGEDRYSSDELSMDRNIDEIGFAIVMKNETIAVETEPFIPHLRPPSPVLKVETNIQSTDPSLG
jgi:hypothetical protein